MSFRIFVLANILFFCIPITTGAQAPDTIWTKIYGGDRNDVAYSVQQTDDMGFIIGGYTYSFPAGNWNVYLIKTDSFGNSLWTKTYGGSLAENCRSVRQTFDGGYILSGRTESFGAGGYDAYLVKTDSNGDTLWTRTFGGVLNEYGVEVEQTADSEYVITGRTASFGTYGVMDVYLIKTDANGDTLWTTVVGGPGYDVGRSVIETFPDSGFIVAG